MKSNYELAKDFIDELGWTEENIKSDRNPISVIAGLMQAFHEQQLRYEKITCQHKAICKIICNGICKENCEFMI